MSFSFLKQWWISLWSSKTNTTTTITDQTTTRSSRKQALCVGINNYPGYGDLKGCINDAKGWKKILKHTFHFAVIILLDSKVTFNNVTKELKKMVKESIKGDHLVFTYSGHGTTTPDRNGDEADGKDEALCLYNGLLVDDVIRKILNELPKGVKFTFISDSCHSGSVTRSFMSAVNSENPSIPKYMPPEDEVGVVALEMLPVKKAVFVPQENMQEILLSGCKSNEYSYDAYFDGKNIGAFSHYSLLILKDNPKITYKDFHKKLREKLPSDRNPQSPQLEGSEANKNSLMFQ